MPATVRWAVRRQCWVRSGSSTARSLSVRVAVGRMLAVVFEFEFEFVIPFIYHRRGRCIKGGGHYLKVFVPSRLGSLAYRPAELYIFYY